MARWRGTTKERGLGQHHVKDKERLLAIHREGTPCWRCGKPMYRAQGLDRDHVIDRAKGGTMGPAVLAHASCNRSAGSRAGNQSKPRLVLAAGRDTICITCGRPYHYAARNCEICLAHYHPNGKTQRTCGRACGVELRRRIYGYAGNAPPRPKPPPKQRKPGPVASGQREPKNGWPTSRLQHWTCLYCGEIGVGKATPQQRRICGDRICWLAVRQATNLRARNGLTREDADAQMATLVKAAKANRRRQS